MSRPMQMYVFVHEAILREVADIEARARELDPEDVQQIGARLEWFQTMTRKHEQAEEAVMFPALNDRYRFVAETYQYDHDDFDAHVFEGITSALTGLRRADGSGDRKEHSRGLYRECVALHEHMRLHIAKENELLVPRIENEFDIAEQADIAGRMAAVFDPPLMAETVAWMYRGQGARDRETMIRFLMAILPEDAFAGMTVMLAEIDTTAWGEMQRRIPELAS